jgi:hypothetical protein
MYCDGDPQPRMIPHQDELAASVGWHRHNEPHPNLLRREFVLPPVQSFVCAEKKVIRWLFIVHHDKDGPRVSKLPEVCVFMDFLPRETSIPAKEGVTFDVGSQGFSNISNSHDETHNRRTAVSSSRVKSFSITVNVESTFLSQTKSENRTPPCRSKHTVPLQSYFRPWESTWGGVSGFQVLPI